MSGNVVPARRYYLLKRLAARHAGDLLETHWRAEQLGQPGTLLPDGFPSKSKLEAVGYVAAEDIDDAGIDELREEVGLNEPQAQAVIDATAATVLWTPLFEDDGTTYMLEEDGSTIMMDV